MKMKVLGLYVLVLALFCTACGSKTALTNDQFIEKMEVAGYQIVDASDQFDEGDIEAVTIAIKDADYQIEFYVLPSSDQTVAAFNTNKAGFEKMEGNGTSNSSVSMGNHSYYRLTTSEGYYVVSRIDNTMIYISTSKEYKDEIKDVLKELGY